MLWAAFIAVHLTVSILVVKGPHNPLYDVTTVYLGWMQQAQAGGPLVGIDVAWVYPIAALLPMWIPLVAGTTGYGYAWLGLVTTLDAIAMWLLLGNGRTRNRMIAGWWWLGFLLLLGGIGVGRLDAITAPLGVVGILLLARHPLASSVVLTVAAWIKVWPVAVVAAALIAAPKRWRILTGAAATSALIVAIGLFAGAGANILSFIPAQASRGVQIEAPVAVPFLWAAVLGVPGAGSFYDQQILTFQVMGPGVDVVSAAMTPLLMLGLLVVAGLGLRAAHAGASATRLFLQLSMAIVLVLVVFNKVGSPQFLCWLIAPTVALIATGERRAPLLACIALVLAGLTQLVYPFFYDDLLLARPWIVTLITFRNAGYILILVLVGRDIWRIGRVQSRRPAPVT